MNMAGDRSRIIPKGSETGWGYIGDLVCGGRLWVGDAQFAPIEGSGEIVDVLPGTYEGYIKQIDYGADIRASRFRIVLAEADAELGAELGETWADTGTQGVCDFDTYSAAIPGDWEEYWQGAEATVMANEFGRYVLDGASDAVLIFTTAGFGDGTFKLFELLADGRRCGIEVEMIPPGTEYPW
jgi:hypothetical protein